MEPVRAGAASSSRMEWIERRYTMLWHLQIEPATGLADLEGERIAAEAADLGFPGPWTIATSRGFLVEGPLTRDDLRRAAEGLLVDPVVETFTIRPSDHPAEGPGTVV